MTSNATTGSANDSAGEAGGTNDGEPTQAADTERLARLIDIWQQSLDGFLLLLEDTPESVWDRPTDLPGWSVHDVVAHLAHLESLLTGGRHVEVEIGEAPHVTSDMDRFTEQGVVARRDASAAELMAELRTAFGARTAALAADPPTDGSATAPGLFGRLGWSVERLLRNRPLDVWMHEQDVRRAIGRPGGLESPGAVHTADYLQESFGYVLGKRVAPADGTTVRLHVVGHRPHSLEMRDGRALATRGVLDPQQADVALDLDREAFILLAGGRRAPVEGSVRITGDRELAERILAAMAVTP